MRLSLLRASLPSRRSVTTAVCMGAKLQNKQVAVVGANRGIGLEFAKQLLQKGNEVYATAREPAQAEDLAKLKQSNSSLHIHQCDTSNLDSVQGFARHLADQRVKLGALFTIAGVYGRAELTDVTPEEMMECFRINAVGPITVVQQMLVNGCLGKKALIANMTSKMGSMTDNTSGGSYPYRCSKAALNAASKSMAMDLGEQGHTVVILHPGWVRTRMTGGGGLIDADQSVAGMLELVESDTPIHGRMFDYKHEEIGW